MVTIEDITGLLEGRVNSLKKRYQFKRIGIYGITDEKDSTTASVDMLVEFDKGVGYEIIDLEDELAGITGNKVSLVARSGLEKTYYKEIKTDLIYVK